MVTVFTTFSHKNVCFYLQINKTSVCDIFFFFSFPESLLNIDTRIKRTLWHVPLVSVLMRFHCQAAYRSLTMLLARPTSAAEYLKPEPCMYALN